MGFGGIWDFWLTKNLFVFALWGFVGGARVPHTWKSSKTLESISAKILAKYMHTAKTIDSDECNFLPTFATKCRYEEHISTHFIAPSRDQLELHEEASHASSYTFAPSLSSSWLSGTSVALAVSSKSRGIAPLGLQTSKKSSGAVHTHVASESMISVWS